MKKNLNLTIVLLKNNFSKMKFKSKTAMILLYAFLIIYFSGIMGYVSFEAIKSLQEINQQALYISICLLVAIGFSLIRTIFTSINVLYFSKDTEYLLPLPIKPKDILIAKLNVLLIYEYIIDIFLCLIPMIIYGILEKVTITYYFLMVIVFLLLPLVPILLSSLLIIFIMRFTNIIKNKDFVQYITIFLVFVLIFGIQFISGNATSNDEITNEELAIMISESNGTVEIFSKAFITVQSATYALINFNNVIGLKNILLFVFETFAIYFVILKISSRLYLKGLVGVNSGAKGKKNKKIRNDYTKKESKALSYIKKEFKLLIRNPIYLMQCVMPSILFPILFSLPIYTSYKNLGAEGMQELMSIKEIINTPMAFAVEFSAIEFLFVFNFIALTAISRDGSNSVFMKQIPIPLYKQCIYKIMPGIIMNIIPILYVTLIAGIFFKQNLLLILGILIISALLNIFENYLMILIDLKKPKLQWTTEYAVVKQNMNMLYQMIFGTVIILVFIAIANMIKNILIISLLSILFFSIGIFIVNNYVKKNETKIFENIN